MLSNKPWRLEYVIMFGAAMMASVCFASVIATILHASGVAGFKKMDDFGLLVIGTLGFKEWLGS